MNYLPMLIGLANLTNALIRPLRWLALLMVLLTFAIVVLRYAFNSGGVVLQDAVMYMHGLFFMMAIVLGISENTHVRVDIFYSRSTHDQQAWIDLAGHLFFLLPVAGFMVWISLPYVVSSWQILEGSSEVRGIPAVFLLKSLIPLTGILMIFQGIASIAGILVEMSEA